MLRSRNINAPLPGTGERPLGRPDTVYQYGSTGRFDQEQLILGLNRRSGRGATLFVRYFLGRARSDTDGAGSFPANPYDLPAEYGPAGIDVRHRFTLGGSLLLPGDIRVSPFAIVSSGRPFNITTGRDDNGDSVFTDRPAYATDSRKPGVVQTAWGLLDPNPEPGQAIIPRNLGRGPWFLMVNLGVGKTIGFGQRPDAETPAAGGEQRRRGAGDRPEGRVTLTLSVSAQNLLNHANPGLPIGNLSSPLFGQAVATAGSFGFGAGSGGGGSAGNRRIELQARVGF